MSVIVKSKESNQEAHPSSLARVCAVLVVSTEANIEIPNIGTGLSSFCLDHVDSTYAASCEDPDPTVLVVQTGL